MKSFYPNDLKTPDLHQYLVSTIAPRPIAFASTVDADGRPNLAPYSFFNIFSSNPPLLVFSSIRRVTNNTVKDTLRNVEETGEVVINVVSHAIVRQMAVASVEFEEGVSEFEKSGLTPLESELVKPFRVQESLAQFECKVLEIKALGDKGGAGHLIICEIVRMHFSEEIFDEEGKIDPDRIDLVGRLGRTFYTRASGDAIFKVYQPFTQMVVGYDGLPDFIKNSRVLTGNNLGQLAGMSAFPKLDNPEKLLKNSEIQKLRHAKDSEMELHRLAKRELDRENTAYATQILLLAEYLKKKI